MTVLLFPDVSQYNATLPAGDVVIARASIGTAKDTRYDAFKAAAAARVFTAYHFLNAPSLGVSVQAQADFAFSVIGPGVPTMLDLEPNRGACASLADGLAWVARFRALGGTCHLCYLPKWSWSTWMGSPDLNALTRTSVGLVSSNYTTYSDNGPGWAPYAPGQPAPVQWQFTDNWNGSGADGNAYPGTVADYLSLITGKNGDDMKTVLVMVKGGDGRVWLSNGLTRYHVGDHTTTDHVTGGQAVLNDVTGGANALLGSLVDTTVHQVDDLDAFGAEIPADLAPRLDALAAQANALQAVGAPTQDQVNAAVLTAMLDPRVQKGVGDAIAAHLKVS